MRRRDFIIAVGGAAAAWPLAARAQQPDRKRRVGVLFNFSESDREGQARIAAFRQGLETLGWTEGRNIQIDYRWAAGDASRLRVDGVELVKLEPDVILSSGTPALAILHQATQAIPIVFCSVSDPVGDGFVASLAKPGSNITGFSNYEPSMGGKWVELLKEAAPGTTRVAFLFNPSTAPYSVFVRPLHVAAQSFGLEAIESRVQDGAEIENAIGMLGAKPGSSLIVVPDGFAFAHRKTIVELAAAHRVPAVYAFSLFARSGGLLSYGTDSVDQFRRASSYVDRILKGTKPRDLPVEAPTKFELVINLKTAKALGLTIPPTLLARADELIE